MALGALLFAMGMQPFYAVLAFAALAFVGASITLEFYRGLRTRHRGRGENYAAALPRLVWANKPRYGGYIVHVGVILIALGIAGSRIFASSVDGTLAVGESLQVQDYTVTYQGLNTSISGDREVVAATLDVYQDGKPDGTIVASKTLTASRPDLPVSDVGLRMGPKEDLYVILAGWDDGGATATFRILVNPLMMWLWIGGGVLLIGTVIAFWPDARAERRLPVAEMAPVRGMRPSHA